MSEQTAWESFFDAHAPIYEDNVFTRNTAQEVDFLPDELHLPPGGSVLDVWCGTGRHAVALAKRGYAVTGLDLSAAIRFSRFSTALRCFACSSTLRAWRRSTCGAEPSGTGAEGRSIWTRSRS